MAFEYRNGLLTCEDLSLSAIADTIGTPVYCYSADAIVARYRQYREALAGLNADICYATKANGTLGIIALLAREGAGADVVSEGEMRRALAAGVPASKIVFSGVGKSRGELQAALIAGIRQINVESVPELDTLNEVAGSLRRRAPIAIRVNPNVDAKTLAKITTGMRENKFGIDIADALDVFENANQMDNIDVQGVAVHIGSQLTDLQPYRRAFNRIADLVRDLESRSIPIRHVDIGGGLGIRYRNEEPPALKDYAAIVRETLGPIGKRITLEPGRSIIGPTGVLLSRVLYVKPTEARTFLIIDAAMNDLMRPALYDAWHDIVPVVEPGEGQTPVDYDVVGPICESTDAFAVQRPIPRCEAGDLVAFLSAGAYGAAMASMYNGRPLVPEVLISGGHLSVIRERPDFAAMVAGEQVPDWLAPGVAAAK